jgi:hypothetical protein
MNNRQNKEKFLKMFKVPKSSTVAFMSGIFFTLFISIGAIIFSTSSFAGSLIPPGSPANTFLHSRTSIT